MVAPSIACGADACHERLGRAEKRDRDLRMKRGKPRQQADTQRPLRPASDEDEGSTTADEKACPRQGSKAAQARAGAAPSEPAREPKGLQGAGPRVVDEPSAKSKREEKMEQKRARTEERQLGREAALRARSKPGKPGRRGCRQAIAGTAAPSQPPPADAEVAEDEEDEAQAAAQERRQRREEERAAVEAGLWELQQLEQLEAEAQAAKEATRAFAEAKARQAAAAQAADEAAGGAARASAAPSPPAQGAQPADEGGQPADDDDLDGWEIL